MKKRNLLLLTTLLLLSACNSKSDYASPTMVTSHSMPIAYEEVSPYADNAPVNTHSTMPKRMIAMRADISMDVDELEIAKDKVLALVEQFSGQIDNDRISDNGYYHASLQVPSLKLMPLLEAIEELGEKTSLSVNKRDITKHFINIQERLKNLKLFRDKMKTLLNQTSKIEEILRIEREVNRVQTEIDMIESQMKNMQGSVDMSPLEVSLKEKTIYGPLGYVGHGIWWVVKKMFVIR